MEKFLCGLYSVCNGLWIQVRLHPDTLVDQSDPHRVDWSMWWE